MNRKGIVELDEKQKAILKDNPVKTNHLPYKWFSQLRFSLRVRWRHKGRQRKWRCRGRYKRSADMI